MIAWNRALSSAVKTVAFCVPLLRWVRAFSFPPFARIIGMPHFVVFSAASIFVAIPPVPNAFVEPI